MVLPAQRLGGRRGLILLAMLVYLAIQIGLPTVKLLSPRPERFGWQMYARADRPARFELERADGSRREIDPRAYLAIWRIDVDLTAALPAHLCRTTPDLVAVRVNPPDAAPGWSYPCR